MQVAILILNYNGRELLEECLPSVLRAAMRSRHSCDVIVIDNESTDESCAFLDANFPSVRVIPRPNRGLCSFNDVISGESGSFDYPVALLLNNDLKLDPEAVDPLIEPFLADESTVEDKTAGAKETASHVFLTAPLCWQFDGITCEGFKTAVRWRWGLVQATGRFHGHQRVLRVPGETACAGAALAVHCERFLQLGGFDPLYLPGRLEDLDLAFRAWQQGWRLRYVPESIAYHKGQVSFGREYGASGCDQLALRNTLLFQWKNLRHPLHQLRQFAGHAVRIARDVVTAPLRKQDERWTFLRAWLAARRIWKAQQSAQQDNHAAVSERKPDSYRTHIAKERAFFLRFHRTTLLAEGQGLAIEYATTANLALDAELRISQAKELDARTFGKSALPRLNTSGGRQ